PTDRPDGGEGHDPGRHARDPAAAVGIGGIGAIGGFARLLISGAPPHAAGGQVALSGGGCQKSASRRVAVRSASVSSSRRRSVRSPWVSSSSWAVAARDAAVNASPEYSLIHSPYGCWSAPPCSASRGANRAPISA